MKNQGFLTLLLITTAACGSDQKNQQPSFADSGNQTIADGINKGAQKFTIKAAIPSADNCATLRLSTYSGTGSGTYKSGCIDGNDNYISLSSNDLITLSGEQDNYLKSSLAEINLHTLAPTYPTQVAGRDETNINVEFFKDGSSFRTYVALTEAVGLPSDLAQFLSLAAKSGFIPGGNFSSRKTP